jgi:hypothetical protein
MLVRSGQSQNGSYGCWDLLHWARELVESAELVRTSVLYLNLFNILQRRTDFVWRPIEAP